MSLHFGIRLGPLRLGVSRRGVSSSVRLGPVTVRSTRRRKRRRAR